MKIQKKKLIDCWGGGLLLVLLKPLVILAGKVLKRDHSPEPKGPVAIFKFIGGGSLVLAYPLLLGIKRRYPDKPLVLFTTVNIRPFGEVLGVFDSILTIDDRSLPALLASYARVFFKLMKLDTVLDLEVHSRLSTVLSTLTCARNRVGFFLEAAVWRKHLHTQLVFFNRLASAPSLYRRMGQELGIAGPSVDECRDVFRQSLLSRVQPEEAKSSNRRLAMGVCCSDLGIERMLQPEQWAVLLPPILSQYGMAKEDLTIVFPGGGQDGAAVDACITALRTVLPGVRMENYAGKLSLVEAVQVISACEAFVGIDSSLLHFARLLGLRTYSFWGPTNPATLLESFDPSRETAVYRKTLCSPCIHVAEVPPCEGCNVCLKRLTSPEFEANADDFCPSVKT